MTEKKSNQLGLIQESAVKEMANIGLGHAVTALSQLTGRSFNMDVPHVEAIGYASISELMGEDDALTVGIYMPIEGEVTGHMAFLFPWPSAVNLWNLLLGQAPNSPADIDELYASAILEVGNIINSSFLNAIADMCDVKMHATPPLVSIDSCAAIAASITVEAEQGDVVALSLETSIFENDNHQNLGYFLCIPNVDGLNLLFERLGIQEAA